MLVFHANTLEEAYALEELHNYLGLVTDEPVHWVAGGLPEEVRRPQAQAVVHFPARGGMETIPERAACQRQDQRLTVQTDLLGFICDTLSCRREEDAPVDAWGRVILRHTQAYRQGLHQVAFLDRLLEGFAAELTSYLTARGIGWERLQAFPGPVACVTHDVDGMFGRSRLRHAAWLARALASGDRSAIRRAAQRVAQFGGADYDPLFPVEMFLEQGPSSGGPAMRHTFFVLSLPLPLGREGWRYTLNCPRVKRRLKKLQAAGHELALHPSRHAQPSGPRLRREKERLDGCLAAPTQALGVRNHYLRGSFPATWRLEQALGFHYDSTLGWADEPGFRVGSARPYRPFDHQKRQRLAIWELPLVLMDGALDGGAVDIAAVARGLSAECFAHHSPATTLWHTNRLRPFDYPQHAQAYAELMEFYGQSGCQQITAAEVIAGFDAHEARLARHRRRASEPK